MRGRIAAAIASAVVGGLLHAPSDSVARDRATYAPPAPAHTVTAATGGTALTFDEPSRTAKLRIEDGGDLDRYMARTDGTLDVTIDMKGFKPATGQSATLEMQVFDVDEQGADDCEPEVDAVTVNGASLGQLSGANDMWSVNTFAVPAGELDADTAELQIDIDTGETGCWAVQVNYLELAFPFNIAHTTTEALDDVDLRRDFTDTAIPDEVWKAAFEGGGGLGPPTSEEPIAAHSNGGGAGAFEYRYEIERWQGGADVDWEPRILTNWQFEGECGNACGSTCYMCAKPVEQTGWDGELDIPVPSATGVYNLVVTFEIFRENEPIASMQRDHKVFVLFDEPKEMNFFDFGLDAEPPRTGWLDRAFAWGAAGHTDAESILVGLTASIYGNPFGWTYGYLSANSQTHTAVELLEHRGTHGECVQFADVLRLLAAVVGLELDYRTYDPGTHFLTSPRQALDGNKSANARPNGGAADRWSFISHYFATYGGKRYDPTFGRVGPADGFEVDGVYCKAELVGGVLRCRLVAEPSVTIPIAQLGSRNDSFWWLVDYTPVGPSPLVGERFAATAAGAATIGTPIGDAPLDLDGNGQYEQLRVAVPVDVTAAGTFRVITTLRTAGGSLLAQGDLGSAVRPIGRTDAVELPVGSHIVPARFSGRLLREAGADGPFTMDVRLFDEAGAPLDSATSSTATYDDQDFQGRLARIGAIMSAAVDTDTVAGDDQLRATVPLEISGAGPVALRAQLFAGETLLAGAHEDIVATSGPRSVTLDFPASDLYAHGTDGPYIVRLTAADRYYESSAEYTTAAYAADDFQPPSTSIARGVTEHAVDEDGDDRYDALDVTAELATRTPADHRVRGVLRDATGNVVAVASITTALAGSGQLVQLRFSGADIGRHGVNGPYAVTLTVERTDGTLLMRRTATTAAYVAGEFQSPDARLTGPHEDSALDGDGDGSPEAVRVTVNVTVRESGDYALAGFLADAEGGIVAAAATGAELAAGAATLTLDFDGGAIRRHGADGPYRLTGLHLTKGSVSVDDRLNAHTTAAYDASSFAARGPVAVDHISDRGSDPDGDGLLDELLVDVTLDVRNSDVYAVNARLYDSTGAEIGWAAEVVGLDPGERVVTLRYAGPELKERNVDGPYRLVDLSIYGAASLIATNQAHTTAAYPANGFEPPGVVRGTVTVNGQPLQGAHVRLRGIRSVQSDAAGTYRLTASRAGAYEIAIGANDAAIGPWRIRIAGQPPQFGYSAAADVALGTETVIDFISPGDVLAPATEATIKPPPNAAGWNTGPVQVRLTTQDEQDGSGVGGMWYRLDPTPEGEETYVDAAEALVDVNGDGARTLTYAAYDNLSNLESPQQLTVRIDATAPEVSVTAPSGGVAYTRGQLVAAAYGCGDATGGSGLISCAGAVAPGQPIDTGTLGDHAFAVHARDAAGNETTETVRYTVAEGNVKDHAAPIVRVTSRARQRIATARRAGIRASCAANEPVRCTVVGEIRAGDARRRLRLKVPPKARWVAIARGTTTLPRAGAAAVVVRMTNPARRALVRTRRLSVRLTATMVDNAGNLARAKRTIRLQRRP